MMKPAALYARVSSDRQRDEHTIASQVAALLAHAQAHGYTVPAEWVFQDEGYSGALLVRPGLERLRDLAADGQLEALLIHSPDRLSRKYAYQVLLIEEFARQGVDVVFLHAPTAATPEDHLLVQFQGMIAEYERAQIAERTRRGKRHRAKDGVVNVLSGAPYGYRYVKKTETTAAAYQVIAREAEVVRMVFALYTEGGLSINAIARRLTAQRVPTRTGRARWERSTVWAMLRNPAYQGTACFGKTEPAPRQKVTRPLRQRGGYSPRCSANRERAREEWLMIPVPALVSAATFALAQEYLGKNKRHAPRRTRVPTLLQGMLVCRECGYAFYRTSTRTTQRTLYYYRCLGSDAYRHPQGRVCHNRPIRQDALDEMVWATLMQLLEDPELIRAEITRRLEADQQATPIRRRTEAIRKEQTRVQRGREKLLDAYQEGLVELDELRHRMPALRQRADALARDLHRLEVTAADHHAYLRLTETIEDFLSRLRLSANTLHVTDRQRILRVVVKEILVDRHTLTIRHSIPVPDSSPTGGSPGRTDMPGYLLRSGRPLPAAREPLPPRGGGSLVRGGGPAAAQGPCAPDPLCR